MSTLAEKALLVDARGDGPWVPVNRLERIIVRDAGEKDMILVRVKDHDLKTNPGPVRIEGSGVTHFIVPKGQIRIERIKGTSRITVLACCRRYHNGPPPTERFGLR